MSTSSDSSREGQSRRRNFNRTNSRPGSSRQRPGGSRGGNRGGGRRFSSRRKGFKGEKININMFVNKDAQPSATPKPIEIKHAFTDFGFHPKLEKAITGRGFVNPTPIQDQTIPHSMEGKDIVGLANTGTGKTAAFLLPLIQKTLLDYQNTTLILTPTRELAEQIRTELRDFTPDMRIFATLCVGGTRIGGQIKRLERHQHFIIGTPGRVIDLVKQGYIDLDKINTLVLDEADRMLDMGFISDMRYVIERMPVERQTLFFSATMSDNIKKLIHDFLRDPVTVSVIVERTSKSIAQDVVRVKGRDKVEVLHELIDQDGFEKIIVFGRTKHGVDRLSRTLFQRGFASDSIHGDKSQRERQRALDKFKKGHISILVATDVAARGIDVPDVSHVINYDVPATYDDYVHRIGRTGRGGKTGSAFTLVD